MLTYPKLVGVDECNEEPENWMYKKYDILRMTPILFEFLDKNSKHYLEEMDFKIFLAEIYDKDLGVYEVQIKMIYNLIKGSGDKLVLADLWE